MSEEQVAILTNKARVNQVSLRGVITAFATSILRVVRFNEAASVGSEESTEETLPFFAPVKKDESAFELFDWIDVNGRISPTQAKPTLSVYIWNLVVLFNRNNISSLLRSLSPADNSSASTPSPPPPSPNVLCRGLRVLLFALTYVDRMVTAKLIRLTVLNTHRVLGVGMFIADKYSSDRPISVQAFSQTAYISVSTVSKLEACFVGGLEYELGGCFSEFSLRLLSKAIGVVAAQRRARVKVQRDQLLKEFDETSSRSRFDSFGQEYGLDSTPTSMFY